VAGVSPVKTLRDCSRHGCLYRLRGWRGLLRRQFSPLVTTLLLFYWRRRNQSRRDV